VASTKVTFPVSFELHNDILVVHIEGDSQQDMALRRDLADVLAFAEENKSVRAVLLCCIDCCSLAGADILEFSVPTNAPSLGDLCNRIEALNKVVVAYLHGASSGAGVAIALSSHYRVASENVSVAMPEVQARLVPGAGVTQRVSRLVGAHVGLDLMLSGRAIGAIEAFSIGLVDKIVGLAEPIEECVAHARRLLSTHAPLRRTRNMDGLNYRPTTLSAIHAARIAANRRAGEVAAISKIIDCVEAASELPFEEGLAFERVRLLECLELAKDNATEAGFLPRVVPHKDS